MHDPLCFEFDNKDDDGFDHSLESPFCYCDFIEKIRSDIASKIIQYGISTHPPHFGAVVCQRCDIISAYNHAAQIAKGK